MRPIILTIFIFISTINSVFTQWIQTESFTAAVTCLISVPASDLPGGEVLYLGLEGNEGGLEINGRRRYMDRNCYE